MRLCVWNINLCWPIEKLVGVMLIIAIERLVQYFPVEVL